MPSTKRGKRPARQPAIKLPPNAKRLPAAAKRAYRAGVRDKGIGGGWSAVRAAGFTRNASGAWVQRPAGRAKRKKTAR